MSLLLAWDWRTLSKMEARKRTHKEQLERKKATKERELQELEDAIVAQIKPTLPTKDSNKRKRTRSDNVSRAYVERYGKALWCGKADYQQALTVAANWRLRVMPLHGGIVIVWILLLRPDMDAATIAERLND